MRLPLIAAVLVAPSLVHAGPITAGVAVGMIQSASDVGSNSPNETLSLYGRFRFTSRLAAQLELQRIETDDQSTDIRTATALLVVDLTAGGRLVPILMVGAGLDDASTSYGESTDGYHIEGGFGLEYRASGGLVIGADARMGGRSISSDTVDQPGPDCCIAYSAPTSTLHDGGYRSVRMTLGVRF